MRRNKTIYMEINQNGHHLEAHQYVWNHYNENYLADKMSSEITKHFEYSLLFNEEGEWDRFFNMVMADCHDAIYSRKTCMNLAKGYEVKIYKYAC